MYAPRCSEEADGVPDGMPVRLQFIHGLCRCLSLRITLLSDTVCPCSQRVTELIFAAHCSMLEVRGQSGVEEAWLGLADGHDQVEGTLICGF